ncbi:MAG: FG-GAP repeat protein [Planctomycetes bacterium]|nr:FG-GAP repeat protein [Planctomycetota bacterium]
MSINCGSDRRLPSPCQSLAAGALVLLAACSSGSGSGGSGQIPSTGAPTIAMVNPTNGLPAGGTLVTITGTGFATNVTGQTIVSFGSTPATDVVVVSDQTVTCVSPAGLVNQTVSIRLQNSRGEAVLSDAFTYLVTSRILSDLNGDGIPDLVAAAPLDSSHGQWSGSVYVLYGVAQDGQSSDAQASQADVKLTGLAANDRFGTALISGDLNGDGIDDLIVGASQADEGGVDSGSVYVFFGPLPASGLINAAEADLRFTGDGTVSGDHFGSAVGLGDLNDDFQDDLLVGAPRADVNAGLPDKIVDAGKAYAFYGGSDLTSRSAQQADVVKSGIEANDRFGNAVCVVDLDGDDLGDMVVAAYLANPYVPPKRWDGGAVYVFRGNGALANGSAALSDWMYTPEAATDEFGSALACGDINGDGLDDLAITAPGSYALGSETGRAYVFFGGSGTASRNGANADVIFSGQQGNGDFGRSAASADVNGDQYMDLVVSSPNASHGAVHNGRCFVFLGGATVHDELAGFADFILTGEAQNGERFGAYSEMVDMDGDGMADVMSGATGNSAGGASAGRVYVFRGQSEPIDGAALADDDVRVTGESENGQFGSSISRGH